MTGDKEYRCPCCGAPRDCDCEIEPLFDPGDPECWAPGDVLLCLTHRTEL
jgi:hypothetical protein